jgi:hypothetical protein
VSSTPRFPRLGANILHGSFSDINPSLFGAEPHQPFAAFNAKGDIDIEDRENEVITTLTLAVSSNGVDPKPKCQGPSHEWYPSLVRHHPAGSKIIKDVSLFELRQSSIRHTTSLGLSRREHDAVSPSGDRPHKEPAGVSLANRGQRLGAHQDSEPTC